MLRTNQPFLEYIRQLYQSTGEVIMKSFPKGSLLLQQDQPATRVMIIREGITKCYFSELNDKDYILEFLGKGEILSEIEVIRNTNCLCTIEAITNVHVYAISIPYFRQLLQTDTTFTGLLLTEFAERLANTAQRASYQQLYTAEHNLARLTELMSDQQLEISKEDMAAYLGISVRSLNRALKQEQK